MNSNMNLLSHLELTSNQNSRGDSSRKPGNKKIWRETFGISNFYLNSNHKAKTTILLLFLQVLHYLLISELYSRK